MIYIRKRKTPNIIAKEATAIKKDPASGYEKLELPKDSIQLRFLFEQMPKATIRSELIKEQHAMIRELVQKGIGIETNPSSNYLISSIQKYNEHPIIRFNGRKLKSTNTNMALQVSINTDDQGVFDTSLENEYALMTIALKKVKNENDQFLYDMEDIYAWIDYVRRMGITQSFKLENSQFERFPFSENIEN